VQVKVSGGVSVEEGESEKVEGGKSVERIGRREKESKARQKGID